VGHTGAVCTKGSSCAEANERDLFDDFGLVLTGTSQRAAMAFSSDQPQGDRHHVFVGFATEQPRLEAQAGSAPPAAGRVMPPISALLPVTRADDSSRVGVIVVVAAVLLCAAKRLRRGRTSRRPARRLPGGGGVSGRSAKPE
jgi:hypothetical protein